MSQIVNVTFDGEAFYPETQLTLEPNKRYQIQIISDLVSLEELEKAYREASKEIDDNWELTTVDGLIDETW